jgi:hypothetical protein
MKIQKCIPADRMCAKRAGEVEISSGKIFTRPPVWAKESVHRLLKTGRRNFEVLPGA